VLLPSECFVKGDDQNALVEEHLLPKESAQFAGSAATQAQGQEQAPEGAPELRRIARNSSGVMTRVRSLGRGFL